MHRGPHPSPLPSLHQATSSGGGWPMSVWLTPNLQPFVGGTYFPPEDGLTRVGFRTVLLRIREQVGVHQGGGQVSKAREQGRPHPMLTSRSAPASHSGNRIRIPC